MPPRRKSATTKLPPPATSAREAAACYARTGPFYMHDVLTSEECESLRNAAQEACGEVLEELLVKSMIASAAGEASPPVRYAEVVERDGGRFDVRHRMAEAPFADLLGADPKWSTVLQVTWP